VVYLLDSLHTPTYALDNYVQYKNETSRWYVCRLRRELLVPLQKVGSPQDVPEGVQHLLPALRLRPAAGHLRQRERLPLLRQHDHQGRKAQVPVIAGLPDPNRRQLASSPRDDDESYMFHVVLLYMLL
jgi:hypothetical protein